MTRRVILLTIIRSICVLGWGQQAHREIVREALSHIGKKNRVTRNFLHQHLGDTEGIIESSSWADSAEAESKYPNSGAWHFSDTPYRNCGKFVMARDCGRGLGGQCLVTGISQMVLKAIDVEESFAGRQDALKFVIHLIGDIHQPLHTAFARDFGGSTIEIISDPNMSLHEMWDFGILEKVDPEDTVGAGGSYNIPTVKTIIPPETISGVDPLIQYTSKLASESSTLLTCESAYQNELGEYIASGDTLSKAYLDSRYMLIKDRLTVAGKRLAELLTSIAKT